MLKKANNRCVKCGCSDGLDVHHIRAKVNGGTDDPENLVVLCKACHAEWHALEIGFKIPYEKWVSLPTLGFLLAVLIQIEKHPEQLDALSAKGLVEAILGLNESCKTMDRH